MKRQPTRSEREHETFVHVPQNTQKNENKFKLLLFEILKVRK